MRNKGIKSDKKIVHLFLNLNLCEYLLAISILGVPVVIEVLQNKTRKKVSNGLRVTLL